VRPEELAARFHVQAAPLLAVLSDAGQIRYLGGYTDRKQGPLIRDREIMDGVRDRKQTPELPLFGCAVSQSLRKIIDPLGIKYGREG
jgi:hypothetical protein